MSNNNQKGTNTQIRNLYSDGVSYMNTSFFNTNLSFRFYPFLNKDQNGRSVYDLQHGQNTTVNYEGAAALHYLAKGIIDGTIQETNLPIPCAGGASLTFERKMAMNGSMETIFSISKNNVIIPFVFKTLQCQVKENGQVITKTIEVGLAAFDAILQGYLTGINADRHLDKLTEDYVKSLGESGNNQQNQNKNNGNFNNNNNYRPNNNNGYKKNYNNNYKKPYNNNNGSWQPPVQQDMSSYNIQN